MQRNELPEHRGVDFRMTDEMIRAEREGLSENIQQTVYLTGEVAPRQYDNLNVTRIAWVGSLDDLVHFVYANESFELFPEGTCVYNRDGVLYIAGESEFDHVYRLHGTWE